MGIIGGVMLGLGASMAGGRPPPRAALSAEAARGALAERPPVPEPPGADGNAPMEAARDGELRRAAGRRLRAREIFTSGLGAAGLADTSRKTLLGG